MAAVADLHLPPGFRFHPTDEELVMHYLCPKCASQSIAVPIIAEIDLYKYDPCDLPGLALHGDKEWYFFSPRDRKYPNGSRPNRAAETGYWKATGPDKLIGNPKPAGIKKALVFYTGKAPKGEKTSWIMHEYRLADADRWARKKNSLRLDDWVLCRIYNKRGSVERRSPPSHGSVNPEANLAAKNETMEEKPKLATGAYRLPPASAVLPASEYVCFDPSEPVSKLHTESSCSEQVVPPEFTSEVPNEPRSRDWDHNTLDVPYNYIDATLESAFGANNQMWPLHDMFMYLQKPF